jgi:hypothetical protein
MSKSSLVKTIRAVLKNHDVQKACLFGSIVDGKFTSKSDIDILVEFNNKNDKSLLDLIDLKSVLEEKTRKKIDLVTFDSLHPSLKDYIMNHNEQIYG